MLLSRFLQLLMLVTTTCCAAGWPSHQLQSFGSSSVNATTFPIGWYDTPSTQSKVFYNVVLWYNDPAVSAETYLDRMKQFEENGTRVVLEVPRSIVGTSNITAITQWATVLRHSNVLLAHYLMDEPHLPTTEVPPFNPDKSPLNIMGGAISNTSLVAAYNAIKKGDPLHFVTIVMSPHYINETLSYQNAMDVLMYDDYPCLQTDTPESRPRLASFYYQVANLSTVARSCDLGGWWFVAQGFGEQLGYRSCGILEERYMVHVAIQHDAEGLFFWRFNRSNSLWVENVANPVVAELLSLMPSFERGQFLPVPITTNSTNISVTLYQEPLTTYVFIAINHGAAPVFANFSMGWVPTTAVARFNVKMEQDKFIVADHATFVDKFAPFTVIWLLMLLSRNTVDTS